MHIQWAREQQVDSFAKTVFRLEKGELHMRSTVHGIKLTKKSPWLRLVQSWQLYVLLLPAIAYLIIFHYVPIYGVQIAFRDYRARDGFLGSNWVGLKHFQYFLASPQFPTLMRNTILLSLYSLLFTFPLPIVLALLLNECNSTFYKKFVQNVTYAPHFISTVVLCGMVMAFIAPDTGIINNLAPYYKVGFPSTLKYTPEEADEISLLEVDLDAYIATMEAKMITGEADIDATWDEFVKGLEDRNLARYLEIVQGAYDRFVG